MALHDSPIFLLDQSPPRLLHFRVSESESQQRAVVRPKVIVVDDERLLADTTGDILRRAGFDTKTAYDGFEALEIMASFHPDYLLSDIVMPSMNGVDLAIAVTKTSPATKVILYSGQAGIADILDEGRTKGYEFPLLAKPVHPLELIEAFKGLKKS